MHPNDNYCTQIVDYLLEAYLRNAQAEVSSIELSRGLELDSDIVRTCLEELVRSGWAEGDLFPLIVWVRLTSEGARSAEGLRGR